MVNPLAAVMGTVQSYSTSLTNAASVLMVIGAELLISSNLFVCPCDTNDDKVLENPADPSLYPRPQARVYYALSYIVWPAVASFVMALAVNGANLRCLTAYKSHCHIGRHCHTMRYFVNNSATVFVPPLAWLVVVFMDGREQAVEVPDRNLAGNATKNAQYYGGPLVGEWYFECAMSKLPTPCLPDIKTVGNRTENHHILRLENEHLRSVSQIIGLTCLGGGITLAALLTLCGQLCSNLTYYQRRYMTMFRQKEMETFNAVSEEMITTELTEKWRKFFAEAESDDWAAISGLPQGGPIEVKGCEYYTNFQVWQPSVGSGADINKPTNGNTPSEASGGVELYGLTPPSKTPPSGSTLASLPRHLVEVPLISNGGGNPGGNYGSFEKLLMPRS